MTNVIKLPSANTGMSFEEYHVAHKEHWDECFLKEKVKKVLSYHSLICYEDIDGTINLARIHDFNNFAEMIGHLETCKAALINHFQENVYE